MEITILARTSLNNFIKQYGVEPHGLLMNHITYELWRIQRRVVFNGTDEESVKFRGLTVYKSYDMEQNKIRFVI